MRILIDPGTYDFTNLGCVAVLQACAERICGLFPGGHVQVLTGDSAGLARYCPQASPLSTRGSRTWHSDTTLLGSFHRFLPARISSSVTRTIRFVRSCRPALLEKALLWKARLRGDGGHALAEYLDAIRQADLVVISGLGGLRGCEIDTLDTLSTALALGKPTAMMGLGLSGEHSAELLDLAGRVLPRVSLLAVRECRTAPSLLRALGVPPERVVVTGDDAIEIAYRERPDQIGSSLGVSLRLQRSSGLDESCIPGIRSVVHPFAMRKAASIQPLPSANDRGIHDFETMRALLDGSGRENSADSSHLDDPCKLIHAVGFCRTVLAGAYHVAVFALSQGIPTVCLAQSEYFMDKMTGLAAMFGDGCSIVRTRQSDFKYALESSLERAWNADEHTRQSLISAAARQVKAGHTAYGHLPALIAPGALVAEAAFA
jgi:polysaccharide pyruvyl transferase WcaK-like protein